jgi:hypothetical protein
MGVLNRGMEPGARIRTGYSRNIDMSSDTRQTSLLAYSRTNEIRIVRATLLFTLDGDTVATQPVTIGVQGALTRYANFSHNVVAATNQEGDTEAVTLTATGTLVAKGVPVICRRAAGATTNVSELVVCLEYELVD